MSFLRGGNKGQQPVDPTPHVTDTPEYREAERTLRAADRWLVEVMREADRVFVPHRRRSRPR